jgi:polar amino acid transport system substrate-binding protein
MEAFWDAVKNSFYMNLVYEDRYLFLVKGFGLTLLMTAVTFVSGTILGAVLCRLRLLRRPWLDRIVTGWCNLLIRLPTLVLLLIVVYVLFSDMQVSTVALAMVAFSLKAGAYIMVIMYSAVTAIDPGEIEAGRTLGMSRFTVFRLVTLPQAIRYGLPTYKSQLIITLQETSLVGFLAINDLTRASQVITSRTMDPYIAIIITAIAYLVIGAVSSLLFRLLERDRHLVRDRDYAVAAEEA